jgi:prepilin-type N-terminal cleavage/methylation domain-containing protein
MKTLSATVEQPSKFKLTADSRLHRASSIQNPESNFASSRIQHPASSIPKGVSRISPCPAFTLLELLAVIIIIAILSGLILGYSKYAMVTGANSRTQAEIAAMETALESYMNDNGTYPTVAGGRASPSGFPQATEINNSGSLYTALAGGSKVYMTFKSDKLKNSGTFTYIVDPFGSPYNYYRPGPSSTDTATNNVTFDLWSYGPDGKNDTGDDIVNWRR